MHQKKDMALKAETEVVNVNGEAISLLVNLALPKSKAWWEFFKEREVQRYSQW